MNTSHFPLASLFGLGASELAVTLMLLILLVVPAALLWMILQQTRREKAGPVAGGAHKKCPDCAELVLAEARVCKHCGYRFDRSEAKPV